MLYIAGQHVPQPAITNRGELFAAQSAIELATPLYLPLGALCTYVPHPQLARWLGWE